MKTKMVAYINIFNTSERIVAPNKLPSNRYHMLASLSRNRAFETMDEKEGNLRVRAHYIKCECHHPVVYGSDGVCTYRNCRHPIEDHP